MIMGMKAMLMMVINNHYRDCPVIMIQVQEQGSGDNSENENEKEVFKDMIK